MIYTVVVKPHSKKGPLVLTTAKNELMVYLREKPVEGEANQALIKLLSDFFDIPKTHIYIKSGTHGRKKLVEISDL